MSHLPKARGDLTYTPQTSSDGTVTYIVYGRYSETYVRFNRLQVAMIEALDGRTDLATLVASIKKQLNARLTIEAAQRFLDQLANLRLLDVASEGYVLSREELSRIARSTMRELGLSEFPSDRHLELYAKGEARALSAAVELLRNGDPCSAFRRLRDQPQRGLIARIAESIHKNFFLALARPRMRFSIVIPLFNPDRWLISMNKYLGWAYTPWFIAALIFAVLWSFWAITVGTPPIRFAFETWTTFDVALLLIIMPLIFLIHELGHGLACRRFGGVVPEMGMMFMYLLMLALYTDTSSTYLCASKSRRIWVQMAGTVTHAICCVAIVVYLYLARDDAAFRSALFFTLVFHFFLIFQNLNPLVRYDGYYALVDYLEIPNLRERSFGYVRSRVGRLFGLSSGPQPELTTRERRIFLLYGISAGVFTVSLIYLLYFEIVYDYLVDYIGGFAIPVTLLLVAISYGGAALEQIRTAIALLKNHHREIFTRRKIAVAAALVVVFVAAVSLIEQPFRIDGEFHFRPENVAFVRPQDPGLVDVLFVAEGDFVARGTIVARLRDDRLQTERARAAAVLEKASLQLAILRLGARKEERLAAAEAHRSHAARSAHSTARLDRRELLARDGLLAPAELSHDRTFVAIEASNAAASAQYVRELEAGARPEELDRAESEVRRAKALVAALDAHLLRLELRAPIDGFVVTPRVEELRDTWLKAGQTLVELHDTRRVRAEISVPAWEPIDKIGRGSRVFLKPIADSNGRSWTEIDGVLPRVEDTKDRHVLLRTSLITLEYARLGLGGRARIYGDVRSIGYIYIVYPLLRLTNLDFWRFWRPAKSEGPFQW